MVAFAARKPDLRLVLPHDEEESAFAAGLQKRIERKVANDAQYLPKSTNMGLPDHISTGVKYNFEEDLESGSGVRTPQKSNKGPLPPSTASFIRSTSCFFVTHVPSTLPWYTEVLGFQVRGKAEASRAELFRGAPGVNRGNDGVFLYLRKISDEGQPVPKGSLWIEVDNIDALYAETSAKLQRYAQDVSDYFPPLYFGSTAKIVAKPRNTAWGQREMTTMDDVGNSIIFYQLLE